jgi:hypothetical protein
VYAKDASTTNSTNFARLNPDRPSADDRASCTPNHTIIVVKRYEHAKGYSFVQDFEPLAETTMT